MAYLLTILAGPRSIYTDISRADLCNIVREVLQILPNAGETFVFRALRPRNIHVQRRRIRSAMRAVDPLSRDMRRSVAISRCAYNALPPNVCGEFNMHCLFLLYNVSNNTCGVNTLY